MHAATGGTRPPGGVTAAGPRGPHRGWCSHCLFFLLTPFVAYHKKKFHQWLSSPPLRRPLWGELRATRCACALSLERSPHHEHPAWIQRASQLPPMGSGQRYWFPLVRPSVTTLILPSRAVNEAIDEVYFSGPLVRPSRDRGGSRRLAHDPPPLAFLTQPSSATAIPRRPRGPR